MKKHGVAFADAVIALEDDFALTVKDPIAVVYTWRGQELRIISARIATRRERRDYEEG